MLFKNGRVPFGGEVNGSIFGFDRFC